MVTEPATLLQKKPSRHTITPTLVVGIDGSRDAHGPGIYVSTYLDNGIDSKNYDGPLASPDSIPDAFPVNSRFGLQQRGRYSGSLFH